MDTYEWGDDHAQDQGNNISPSGQCDVLLDDHNEAENKTAKEDNTVPPLRHFFVILCHVLVVTVVIFAFAGTFVGVKNVASPKDDAVHQQSADLEYSQR